MAFIARLDKPCTFCQVVIPKGASGTFTWDRSKGGFIHLDCMKQRKLGGTPVPASPAIGVCVRCLKDVLADEPSIEQGGKMWHAGCVYAAEAEADTCTKCRLPKQAGPGHYKGCEFYQSTGPADSSLCPWCAVPSALPANEHAIDCKFRVGFGTVVTMIECPFNCGVEATDRMQLDAHIKDKHTTKALPAPSNGGTGTADELARLIQKLAGQRGIDEKEVRRIAADEAAKVSVNRSISITVDKMHAVKFDSAHADLPVLIRLANLRDVNGHRTNIYMYGPAGSGKSTAARQVSKALFPDATDKYGYISLNPQTPESRLIGYMHAGGEYVPTEFFKRFTQGGVFCIDEIDNAAASLLATLNGLLANGHGAFPHGVFERHADFVCIATGNTIGLGGDVNYPERRPLDGATRDRFYFMEWGYDMDLIKSILTAVLGADAGEFMAWVKREAQELQARYPTHIVSPRAYIQGAALEKIGGYTRNQIKNMVISRGLK